MLEQSTPDNRPAALTRGQVRPFHWRDGLPKMEFPKTRKHFQIILKALSLQMGPGHAAGGVFAQKALAFCLHEDLPIVRNLSVKYSIPRLKASIPLTGMTSNQPLVC
jgi:hypothetical protein